MTNRVKELSLKHFLRTNRFSNENRVKREGIQKSELKEKQVKIHLSYESVSELNLLTGLVHKRHFFSQNLSNIPPLEC